MSDVYEKLRQRLDDMATGYPPSANGVEIKILKRLFSEADAEMFLMMTPMLETPEAVAERLNLDPAQTAAHLEDMAYRGLLFRQRKADMVRYATIPFVVGVFEFQLKKVDKDLANDLQAYYEEALGKTFAASQYRRHANHPDPSPPGGRMAGGALRRCAGHLRPAENHRGGALHLPDHPEKARPGLRQTPGGLFPVRFPRPVLCRQPHGTVYRQGGSERTRENKRSRRPW